MYTKGAPMIAAGSKAIEIISGKKMNRCTDKDLKKASKELADLYLTPSWKKQLVSIFPNSQFTQVSFPKNITTKKSKREHARERSLEFMDGLIRKRNIKKAKEICNFCGKPTETKAVKTLIPGIGSAKYTNFFSGFSQGIYVCANCQLAILFAPLVAIKVGGKPAYVCSNNEKIMDTIYQEAYSYVQKNKALGAYQKADVSGIYTKKSLNHPRDAIFNISYDLLINHAHIIRNNDEIDVFRIDNFNQNPGGVEIYHLPNTIIHFFIQIRKSSEHWEEWMEFIKKKPFIHQWILDGKDILRQFWQKRETLVHWKIVEFYCMEVKKMNKQKLDKIKKLGDDIVTVVEDCGQKKYIGNIEKAHSTAELQGSLLKLQRKAKKNILDYDDISNLFYTDTSYREVQNLLLFRIYEKMNEKKEVNKEQEEK